MFRKYVVTFTHPSLAINARPVLHAVLDTLHAAEIVLETQQRSTFLRGYEFRDVHFETETEFDYASARC